MLMQIILFYLVFSKVYFSQNEEEMSKIHLCERCKYCTHSPNLFQPYYWCSWYGKEVRTPIQRCNNLKTD